MKNDNLAYPSSRMQGDFGGHAKCLNKVLDPGVS